MSYGSESVGAIAETIAEARVEAHRVLPFGAKVVSERILGFQESRVFVIEAPEYETAGNHAMQLMGEPSTASIRLNSFDSCTTDMPLLWVRSVRFLGPGQDELLRYEVVVIRRVAVEVSYNRMPM